jgi:Zn-dependent protease with chaperone function
MVFALRLRTGVGFLLALAAIWLPVGGLCYGLSQINLDAARVVLVVLFLGHAVYALRAIKPAGREIGPTSTDPYGEWVYRMAEAVRPAAGLSKLKIFIRPDDEPNTWVAHCPGSAPVLVVNKGLIDRYTDGALFQAILAHQLGHILTGDAVWRTVFLDLPALVLEVAQSVPLALGAGLLALLRGFSQCFDRRAVGPGCLNVVSAPFRLLFDQLCRGQIHLGL